METWLQHLFLAGSMRKAWAITVVLLGASLNAQAEMDIDTEFFELGVTVGVINVQDFTSEFGYGFTGSFRTTEDFFLQFNWLTADVSLSSVEETEGSYTGDRSYQHFNLLLGFNLFQGEIFRGGEDGLSSLYVVGGVGDTEFLDESNFTYVYGLGYQMALTRSYSLRFDYRNYLYDTSIIDEKEYSSTSGHLSVGLTWLF